MDGAASPRAEDAPRELRAEGPPWILGERGAPHAAPENTLASFRAALDADLDGLCYDLRACAGGDPVVIADARLERTTDGAGLVREHGLPELFGLDAGGWFAKRFAGAGVPHLDEVLDLEGRGDVRHLVRVRDEALVPELAGAGRWPRRVPPCFLSRRREVVTALADAGLACGLVVATADEDTRAWVRDARVEVVATETPRGWLSEAGAREWGAERWALGVDEAEDLFALMHRGVTGLSTREPRRALAVRALRAHAPRLERYPLEVPALLVDASHDPQGGGEWSGHWEPHAVVTNPFDHGVRVALDLFVRRGAFDVEGLPRRFDLGPGEAQRVAFRLRGGSWSPGGDPVLAALFAWDDGSLLVDATLRRERRAVAGGLTQRLEMLRESPGAPAATMTLQRRGRELVVRVENPGGLVGARAVVHLDGQVATGARALRLRLPAGFDDLARGVAFSCGFVGHASDGGPELLRRWAGGLPREGDHGAPGRLLAR
ncbi:MAG: hypothetical protein H6828_12210 [Planctomycetes bacterium]|nr:hypothetical protein [Planctomycetota bacterium]